MIPVELPETAVALLAEVVNHHRDRDESVWQEIGGYAAHVAQSSPESPDARYQLAVREISEYLTARGAVFLDALEESLGASAFSRCSPRAQEVFRTLEPAARCAHALAMDAACALSGAASRAALFTSGLPLGSRVHSAFPVVSSLLTKKDLLLPVRDAVSFAPSWVNIQQTSFQLHPGLRRGFGSGRVNNRLIHALSAMQKRGLEVSVAIDSSRWCPQGQLFAVLEADHWFGAPLRLAELDNPHHVGATLHERVRSRGPMAADMKGLRTEFRWSFKDELKTFEAEELPLPSDSEQTICRYVHAIRSTTECRWVHLDGALHIYDTEHFRERYAHAADHARGKVWADQKIKLFRVDVPADEPKSEIQTAEWEELITQFFRGNELVVEYLCGRPYDELYKDWYGRDFPNFDR